MKKKFTDQFYFVYNSNFVTKMSILKGGDYKDDMSTRPSDRAA